MLDAQVKRKLKSLKLELSSLETALEEENYNAAFSLTSIILHDVKDLIETIDKTDGSPPDDEVPMSKAG
jgi:hypothetical protein